MTGNGSALFVSALSVLPVCSTRYLQELLVSGERDLTDSSSYNPDVPTDIEADVEFEKYNF